MGLLSFICNNSDRYKVGPPYMTGVLDSKTGKLYFLSNDYKKMFTWDPISREFVTDNVKVIDKRNKTNHDDK